MNKHKWGFVDIHFNEDERPKVEGLIKRLLKTSCSSDEGESDSGLDGYQFCRQLLSKATYKEIK